MSRSTFSLSRVYTALGIRDPRAVPDIAAGVVQPTIQMGEVSTFAPQVVEARGISGSNATESTTLGTWNAFAILSRAEGGILLEEVNVLTGGVWLNLAPNEPFSTFAWTEVLSIGGAPLRSELRFVDRQGGAPPRGRDFGGTDLNSNIINTVGTFTNIYVPPGSWFWTHLELPNVTMGVRYRWREFPEGLGSA